MNEQPDSKTRNYEFCVRISSAIKARGYTAEFAKPGEGFDLKDNSNGEYVDQRGVRPIRRSIRSARCWLCSPPSNWTAIGRPTRWLARLLTHGDPTAALQPGYEQDLAALTAILEGSEPAPVVNAPANHNEPTKIDFAQSLRHWAPGYRRAIPLPNE